MKRLFLAFAVIPALVAAYSFMEGVAGYFSGTAIMRGVGYPGPEYHNLDPEYRVYRQTSGCLVMGTEILTHVPNNVAIALLASAFGPMRGAYDGPYPTRQEAFETLRSAPEMVSLEALHGWPELATDCPAISTRFPPRADYPVARCAMFRDRTIVVGLAGRASLVDARTGKVYARYQGE